MTEKIAWGKIFSLLEKWQKNHSDSGEAKDPAVDELAKEYGQKAEAPWAVLVSTILSLRTKDEVTRFCSKALLEKAPNPRALLRLGQAETARLAYPAGFYRTKAAQLQKIAEILLEKYKGRVPADMDALLALPGVGRKTANLVLSEAFDMDAICVDIHVHRISNRLGLVKTKDPLGTEMALREILPLRYWKRINGLLVLYGQNICRPVSPFCSRCVIYNYCRKNDVDRSR